MNKNVPPTRARKGIGSRAYLTSLTNPTWYISPRFSNTLHCISLTCTLYCRVIKKAALSPLLSFKINLLRLWSKDKNWEKERANSIKRFEYFQLADWYCKIRDKRGGTLLIERHVIRIKPNVISPKNCNRKCSLELSQIRLATIFRFIKIQVPSAWCEKWFVEYIATRENDRWDKPRSRVRAVSLISSVLSHGIDYGLNTTKTNCFRVEVQFFTFTLASNCKVVCGPVKTNHACIIYRRFTSE